MWTLNSSSSKKFFLQNSQYGCRNTTFPNSSISPLYKCLFSWLKVYNFCSYKTHVFFSKHISLKLLTIKVPNMPVMLLFQMFFEESNWWEFLIILAWLPVCLYEAFVFSKLLKCLLTFQVDVKNITIHFVRDDLSLNAWKGLEFGHDYHLFAGGLELIKIRYFTDWAGVIFTDDSHFVNASVTDWLMVTLSDSNEFGFLCAKDTLLFCHLCFRFYLSKRLIVTFLFYKLLL